MIASVAAAESGRLRMQAPKAMDTTGLSGMLQAFTDTSRPNGSKGGFHTSPFQCFNVSRWLVAHLLTNSCSCNDCYSGRKQQGNDLLGRLQPTASSPSAVESGSKGSTASMDATASPTVPDTLESILKGGTAEGAASGCTAPILPRSSCSHFAFSTSWIDAHRNSSALLCASHGRMSTIALQYKRVYYNSRLRVEAAKYIEWRQRLRIPVPATAREAVSKYQTSEVR